MAGALCLLSFLFTVTSCNNKNALDRVSPTSLATQRLAHPTDVIVLSRSHLFLAKTGPKIIGGACCARWSYSVGDDCASPGQESGRTFLRPQGHQHHRPRSRAGRAVLISLFSHALQLRGVMIVPEVEQPWGKERGAAETLQTGWTVSSPHWGCVVRIQKSEDDRVSLQTRIYQAVQRGRSWRAEKTQR